MIDEETTDEVINDVVEDVVDEVVDEDEGDDTVDEVVEDKPEDKEPAKPDDAQLEAWAKEKGFVKPEVKEEKKTEAPDELPAPTWDKNPREQAYAEAQSQGKDADWAENRAFEIHAERVSAANDHRDLINEVKNLEASRADTVSNYETQFEKNGLPKEAAAEVYDTIVAFAKQGHKGAASNLEIKKLAIKQAIGSWVINELDAGRNPFSGDVEPPKQLVTQTGGSGGSQANLSQFSKQDQAFLTNWSKTKNKGNKPTTKQLENLKAEGLIG